jgi:hypothetical protein
MGRMRPTENGTHLHLAKILCDITSRAGREQLRTTYIYIRTRKRLGISTKGREVLHFFHLLFVTEEFFKVLS